VPLQEDLLPVPALLFQGSFLLGGIAKAVLGPGAAGAGPTLIHPFLVSGWCGLVVTALNLLPVGSLDGGRMVQVRASHLTVSPLCVERLLADWEASGLAWCGYTLSLCRLLGGAPTHECMW
jgi:membrane-associated protease RseP (regulator of RpoE activity)